MAGPGRIDVHHHMVPDFYRETLAGLGLTASAGVPLPPWSPAASLEVMDAHGIAAAILSLSVPGVYFGDLTAAKRLARECNEAGARIAGDHPGRFGWFAVLPLPLTGAAVEEAIFALDTLHADGVVLLASNAGTFLGDPAFEELMAQLDVRATVAFVHSAPARSAGPGARATLTSTQSPTAGTRRPPPHGRGGLPQSVDDSSKAVPPGGGPSTHGGEACQ
jgi:predicted TIM-barrel fold metal-dependent hydrolase